MAIAGYGRMIASITARFELSRPLQRERLEVGRLDGAMVSLKFAFQPIVGQDG